MRQKTTGLIAALLITVWAVTGWTQTNLMVVRHSDNTIWAMTCEGTSDCSAWTQIAGGFSIQPTLTWDPALQKYLLTGIGDNGSNIWRSTLNADGTWNNDWVLIGTGVTGSPSPVASAGGGFEASGKSPMEIALLKWYGASQVATFAVGSGPIGIAFDGANIWVANYYSYNVTKLNAATGAVVGTYGVGFFPCGIAFDGANIWVVNSGSNNVMKLRASDGSLTGTYNVGTNPFGVCFDGANIWVPNIGSNNVTKLNAATGAVVGTYGVGGGPRAIAFDGANIWVANSTSNNVTKLNAATGAVVGTYGVVMGDYPYGIAFDGANIWVTNGTANTVSKL